MTRGEAIQELEILKEDYWNDDGYGHETKQYDDIMLALKMAIEALEQEPVVYTVSFDRGLKDESAFCVTRICGGKTTVLNTGFGEEADSLYNFLTEQMAKEQSRV